MHCLSECRPCDCYWRSARLLCRLRAWSGGRPTTFTVQQTPSNLWHEYFHVFIQSFFERVAAGLGWFWHTNHFFVYLRSVNISVKHYKHERKEFWDSLLSVEFFFMVICSITGETGFTRAGSITSSAASGTCIINSWAVVCGVWLLSRAGEAAWTYCQVCAAVS